MGALDRYDQWEAALDVPALDELYDAATLRALETGVEPPAEEPVRWRTTLAAGALVGGLARGSGDQPQSRDDGAVAEVYQEQPRVCLEPVSIHLAWGEPAAGVAIVRRWLFSDAALTS